MNISSNYSFYHNGSDSPGNVSDISSDMSTSMNSYTSRKTNLTNRTEGFYGPSFDRGEVGWHGASNWSLLEARLMISENALNRVNAENLLLKSDIRVLTICNKDLECQITSVNNDIKTFIALDENLEKISPVIKREIKAKLKYKPFGHDEFSSDLDDCKEYGVKPEERWVLYTLPGSGPFDMDLSDSLIGEKLGGEGGPLTEKVKKAVPAFRPRYPGTLLNNLSITPFSLYFFEKLNSQITESARKVSHSNDLEKLPAITSASIVKSAIAVIGMIVLSVMKRF